MGNLSDIFGGDMSVPEDALNRGALPVGKYLVQIEKAEIKDNKTGTGNGLSLQFTVIGDKFTNAKVFTWINLQNPSQQAMNIGKKELGQLAIACGFKGIPDSEDELLGKQLVVKLKIREDKPDENDITGYYPATEETFISAPTKKTNPSSIQPPPTEQKQESAPTEKPKRLPWE